VWLFIAIGAIQLTSGCRTPELRIEEPGDVSSYRTWDFVRPVRGLIHAPLFRGVDLEPVVAMQVETWLSEQGFRRAPNDPDILVYFQLVVRGQLVKENVTGAMQHVPSHDYTPSFDVQATRTEIRHYEIAEFLILMIDPSERRLVWRGRLTERYQNAFEPHLREAVSQLLAHIPPPRPASKGTTVIVKEEKSQRTRTTSVQKPAIEALAEPGG
jgi:hypothetical protein